MMNDDDLLPIAEALGKMDGMRPLDQNAVLLKIQHLAQDIHHNRAYIEALPEADLEKAIEFWINGDPLRKAVWGTIGRKLRAGVKGAKAGVKGAADFVAKDIDRAAKSGERAGAMLGEKIGEKLGRLDRGGQKKAMESARFKAKVKASDQLKGAPRPKPQVVDGKTVVDANQRADFIRGERTASRHMARSGGTAGLKEKQNFIDRSAVAGRERGREIGNAVGTATGAVAWGAAGAAAAAGAGNLTQKELEQRRAAAKSGAEKRRQSMGGGEAYKADEGDGLNKVFAALGRKAGAAIGRKLGAARGARIGAKDLNAGGVKRMRDFGARRGAEVGGAIGQGAGRAAGYSAVAAGGAAAGYAASERSRRRKKPMGEEAAYKAEYSQIEYMELVKLAPNGVSAELRSLSKADRGVVLEDADYLADELIEIDRDMVGRPVAKVLATAQDWMLTGDVGLKKTVARALVERDALHCLGPIVG